MLLARWAARIGSRSRTLARRIARRELAAFVGSAALAVLAAIALHVWLLSDLAQLYVSLGFDGDRAQILGGLTLALPSALLGALPMRKRAAALLGTLLGLTWTVMFPYFQVSMHPTQDAAGQTVTVSGGSLAHAVLVLYALGILVAALGAGLGHMLGDWLAAPLVRLAVLSAALMRERWHVEKRTGGAHAPAAQPPALRAWAWPAAQAGAAAAVLALGLVSISGAGDLLFYGPQALVQPPVPATRDSQTSVSLTGSVSTVTFTSAAFGGQPRSFDIYLPPGYASPTSASVRYPVVYVLHGTPGTKYGMLHALLTAQVLDELITSQQIQSLIAVAPDGNSSSPYVSEWLNGADGRAPVEDSFVREVVPYVDQHYRTLASPDSRILAGISMGGFGAANLALKYPNLFGGVIAMGAYFIPEGGALRGHRALIVANSPALQLQHATVAPYTAFYLAAAQDDRPYVTDTRLFAQELAALGAGYTLQVAPSGGHSWTLWERQIVNGLRWFLGENQGPHRCSGCSQTS
jgi:enterochelin esterase-like enzyme